MQSTDKTKQYLMTEGPIHQRVLRYAIPVFIGYLFICFSSCTTPPTR